MEAVFFFLPRGELAQRRARLREQKQQALAHLAQEEQGVRQMLLEEWRVYDEFQFRGVDHDRVRAAYEAAVEKKTQRSRDSLASQSRKSN